MASNDVAPIAGAGDNALVMNTSASGNLSFEVVLSPARAIASPRANKVLKAPTPTSSPRSLEDITTKLKTAEENRERLKDEKLEKLEKLREQEKRAVEFRKMQEAEAQRKLENSLRKHAIAEELRQQRLEQLTEKLKEHDNRIEQARKRLAAKGESNGEDLQRELDDATDSREMVVEAIKKKEQEKSNVAIAKENLIPERL